MFHHTFCHGFFRLFEISDFFKKLPNLRKREKPYLQQEHGAAEIIEEIIEETNEINVKWNHLQPFMRDLVKHNENTGNEQKYMENVGECFFIYFVFATLEPVSNKFQSIKTKDKIFYNNFQK